MNTACYGLMCPKHELCQLYDDAETSDDKLWQATCGHGDGKYPGFLSRVATPPLINKLEGTYTGEVGAPVRNDGHKGIKSRGLPC